MRANANVIQPRSASPHALALLVFVSMSAPGLASAAGWAQGAQGTAALGLGGAATARLDLAEAGFYNPSALALHDGLNLGLGAALIAPSITHVGVDGRLTAADTGVSVPPFGSVGYGFGRWALGIAFGVPFGSGLTWPTAGFAGRFEATDVALRTYEGAAHVAVQPVDGLSFAAGVRLLHSTVEMGRQIDAVTREGTVQLAGSGQGVGASVSAAWQAMEWLDVGVTYRSRVSVAYDGAAHFDVPVELSTRAQDGAIRADITFPDRITAGLTARFFASTVSLDAEYTTWSTVDALRIDFVDDTAPDIDQTRNWEDTLGIKVGYEQRLTDTLRLRGGIAWDPTPVPEETLTPSSPDGDRVVLSLGASLTVMSGLDAHLAYANVIGLAQESLAEGTGGSYELGAHLVSLGLSYR